MLDIIIITAVQIIIEALPISSSGHVLLAQLAWEKYAAQPFVQLPDFFDHFLHGPTVLILLVVFFKDWFYSARRLLFAWGSRFFCRRSPRWSERRLTGVFLKIVGFVCAADAITAIAYVAKSALEKNTAFLTDPRVLLGAFCVTAILLLSLLFLDYRSCWNLKGGAGGPGRHSHLGDGGNGLQLISNAFTLEKSLIIGTVQGIALIFTGLSRFGSTYVIGRWLGLSPRRSFQFSFLIQFPLIAAAFVFNGVRGMLKVPDIGVILNMPMIATMLSATIISGLLFALVYRLALKRKLGWLGVYMLVPIIYLLILLTN